MRILLVDGRESSRRNQRPVLQAAGVRELIECDRAGEALHQVRLRRPDLLLVADRLPDMDGLDLIREVKRLAPEVPAVVIGEDGSPDRVIAAIRAGADNFISAPWTPDLLYQRIAETLARMARPAA